MEIYMTPIQVVGEHYLAGTAIIRRVARWLILAGVATCSVWLFWLGLQILAWLTVAGLKVLILATVAWWGLRLAQSLA